MKKLRELIYRIDRPLELSAVVDDVFKEYELNKSGETHDVCLGVPPEVFPYIVIVNLRAESSTVDIEYVTPADFINREEGAKERLFEFRIKRTDRDSPYRVRESDYQIPARDLFEAHLKLGQVHHNDDRYELEVLSWKQVK